MEPVPRTVAAFQRNRRATWKAIRWWIVLLAVAAIGFQIPFWINRDKVDTSRSTPGHYREELSPENETEGQFTLGLVSLCLAGLSIAVISFAIQRHYRCPRCNEVPMGSWTSFGPGGFGWSKGVAMRPTVCPNCGARLK
jgi:DNA-directed RNA polymerase subunit RPC12/RpoP